MGVPGRGKGVRRTRAGGFESPDRGVVGYGLDYAEGHRNLPFVAVREH